MEKANSTETKFWAGGAREFHQTEKKHKIRTGFFGFLDRFTSVFRIDEIDHRLFIKKGKKKP